MDREIRSSAADGDVRVSLLHGRIRNGNGTDSHRQKTGDRTRDHAQGIGIIDASMSEQRDNSDACAGDVE